MLVWRKLDHWRDMCLHQKFFGIQWLKDTKVRLGKMFSRPEDKHREQKQMRKLKTECLDGFYCRLVLSGILTQLLMSPGNRWGNCATWHWKQIYTKTHPTYSSHSNSKPCHVMDETCQRLFHLSPLTKWAGFSEENRWREHTEREETALQEHINTKQNIKELYL